MGARVYIGVTREGEVACIAISREMLLPSLFVVSGRFDDQEMGVIHVIDDGSMAAAAVLRTREPGEIVGLGWSFR